MKLILFESLNIFLFSLIVTFILTPYLYTFAYKIKLLDIPGGRKKQKKPIPLSGGISFLLISLCVLTLIRYHLDDYINIVIAILIIFTIGIIDDFYKSKGKDFSSVYKMIFYILAAIISVYSDNRISNILLLDKIYYFATFTSMILTIVWLVSITNMYNFTDGNDGLACGYAIIISFVLIIISLEEKNIVTLFLSIFILGSNIGFIKFNWFPAKIYMGDCGSSLIGFFIAYIELRLFLLNVDINKIISLSILMFLPIFDTIRVIFNRLYNKKAIYKADRSQIHFILIDKGISDKKTTIILISFYIMCAIISLISYYKLK